MEELENDNKIQVITGITKDKMEAIVNLSKAIYKLSEALNSTNAHVTIQNCSVSNSDVGIKIGNE